MGYMFKFIYMGVLVTTMVQAPGQVAAMLLDHTSTTSYQNYSYSQTTPQANTNSGYAMACHSLSGIQSTAYKSNNTIEAKAVGFYRDIIASAAGRSGFGARC